MEKAIVMALAPFMLVLLLYLAKPFNRLAMKFLPKGKVRNFLLKPRSNRSERMERADKWVGDQFSALFRRIRGK